MQQLIKGTSMSFLGNDELARHMSDVENTVHHEQ
jgi:hypothetical protein